MNTKSLYFVLGFLLIGCASKQDSANTKLVVGIVVDQMRMDYLYRFQSHFGEQGFKRFYNEGFVAKNHHFDYRQTKTGPGHASIATGTPPAVNGIIGNDWFDKQRRKERYCVDDQNFLSLGTAKTSGKAPTALLVSTFADENRLATQMNGKAVSVSLKDRSAILSIGHTANGAYWFSGGGEGNFISSTFYMDALPSWVIDFNASRKIDEYLTTWDTYYPISQYAETGPDDSPYEKRPKGKDTPTFPYDLAALSPNNGDYEILRATPFGNSLVTDFALAALKGEDLGTDDHADVFMVSYSSPDHVGHAFGTNAKELQDTYIRLDLEIARFFKELDAQVGKGAYSVFLTSDHGVAPVPNYLIDNKIPAGYFSNKPFVKALKEAVFDAFGVRDIVLNVSNNEIYFDHDRIFAASLDIDVISRFATAFIQQQDGIAAAYSTSNLMRMDAGNPIVERLQKGYNPKRSGDVIYMQLPAYIANRTYGTTHGSAFIYDTHVPLLLYGNGIQKGSTFKRTKISDIAPTICALLEIGNPTGVIGNPIGEALKSR
ncbi:MAG: alkaline phosphatase [Flavobacteriaceae bacterium]|nr:alkaline phosphatase [Flavobacteriaceae bacterium]